MENILVPFLSAPPNLADARYVSGLREMFAVNYRNVILLGIYFVVLLVVAYALIGWQPVRGTVTRHGLGVGMGRPQAMRKLHWVLAQPPLEGSTPYLPAPIVLQAPEGTGVWVGVDPTGASRPLFLGFVR
jgi:hypothetical protein